MPGSYPRKINFTGIAIQSGEPGYSYANHQLDRRRKDSPRAAFLPMRK